MKKRTFLLLLCVVFATNASSQITYIAGPAVAYQYQRHDIYKLSAFSLLQLNEQLLFKIDLGADLIRLPKKHVVTPELGLSLCIPSDRGVFLLKGEFTPYTITPKIGIQLFLFEIGVGYGFNISRREDLKPIDGFAFSVGLNLFCLSNRPFF